MYFTLVLFATFLFAIFLLCIDYINDICIQEFILDINDTLYQKISSCEITRNDRSFETEDKELPRPSFSSLDYSEVHSSTSNILNNNNNIIKSNILTQLKTRVKDRTRFFVLKIKLYNRTLSYFFKGSRPGGGRGL